MLIVPFHLSVQCWFRIMLVCTNTSHRNAHCTISFLKPQVLVCFSFKISISLSEYPSSQRSFLHPEAGTESLLVWMLPDRQIHPPYKSDCCRTFHLPLRSSSTSVELMIPLLSVRQYFATEKALCWESSRL